MAKGSTTTWRGRAQARRLYQLGACEDCGRPGVDRHHKDGDTDNNLPENIAILCRRCHQEEDGRLEGLRERAAAFAQQQKERTHCPRNHPYDEANTYTHRGHRYCRACNRESKQRAWAARG